MECESGSVGTSPLISLPLARCQREDPPLADCVGFEPGRLPLAAVCRPLAGRERALSVEAHPDPRCEERELDAESQLEFFPQEEGCSVSQAALTGRRRLHDSQHPSR
ncbi:unnamed protein product [Pleuronectes platessa]|uniref:Uncharacterized protein n=1 Tax=Pleuronectes platessa TaxID=8262 RepID=A0A9N7TI93_PLEPL|nr:unnamed protein product [Pleuronectes platessa]